MPFTEDLSAFFSDRDFGTPAQYKPGGAGSGVAVRVIFDRPGHDVLGANSTKPVARGIASVFADVNLASDTIVIAGVTYRIVGANEVEDGAMVDLDLEDQS